MHTTIDVQFSLISWDETTWDGENAQAITGTKLTRATVKQQYSGAMQGTSHLEYTMYYREDNSGTVSSFERFTGEIEGKSGSFVMQHSGTFDNDGVTMQGVIVEGSGTGELAGICGAAHMNLGGHGESYPFTLRYSWE